MCIKSVALGNYIARHGRHRQTEYAGIEDQIDKEEYGYNRL